MADDSKMPRHKHYAETGEYPDLGTVDSAFKSVPDGDQRAAHRGLADSQRAMTKRGKDADHGEY